MDKSQIKESILRMFEAELDAWLEIEPKINDAFEYERDLLDRTLRVGKGMITLSQGKIPKDRNAKKSLYRFWTSRIKKGASASTHQVQNYGFCAVNYLPVISTICIC
jgi:hypothetical protein